MSRWLVTIGAALWLAGSAGATEVAIGYLELSGDRRYSQERAEARYLLQPLGRPYAGAVVAVGELRFPAAAAGVTLVLRRERAATAAALLDALASMRAGGTQLFLLDLSDEAAALVARETRGQDILLFNLSARADRLRGPDCQAHLLHIVPSLAMEMDALAQYLALRKWRDVLVLQGPGEADAAFGDGFAAAAHKYGLRIVERRPFVLSNDPRERDRNNVVLLTNRGSYDVIFVADSDGEFARGVPYATARPRAVVGAAGLAAVAWHWSWERHGAPQLEGRFEKAAKRHMGSHDWAAWAAVKAIFAAVQRTGSAEFADTRAYLRGAEFELDVFKGAVASFRPWDNQLRQPILLATDTWVVARAPIDGFLHRDNNLDTLGIDRPESKCRF
jgi:ABC transporter substrate binding protein (PQQ-dependent alcohol dehydrogenase system)